MYARLWWKDARQFATIWLGLAVSAAVTQWLVLSLVDGARDGALVPLAMSWAWLYALAVGAAAFAGERETGTLRFLDILPVSRRTLWAGKVAFAMVSTAALAAVLLGMAALHTDRVLMRSNPEIGVWTLAGWLAIPLTLALALGLFWSSFTKTALTAAILAAVCASFSVGPFLATADADTFGLDWRRGALLELLAALILLAVSDWWVTRPERGGRLISRGTTRPRSPLVRVARPEESLSVAYAEMPGRGYTRRAVPALIAMTVRRGFPTWALLAAVGWLVPALLGVGSTQVDPILVMSLASLVAVGAGVSAFQAETRDRTHRFLAHHGVRPGVVWAVKVGVWLVGLIVIIFGSLSLVLSQPSSMPLRLEQAGHVLLAVPLAFALGVLGGASARRGITAALVSILATIAVGVPLTSLTRAGMLPRLGILAVPPVILWVSWAWSGDWLLDRPAPGRWIRLALLLTFGFLGLFGIYIYYRIFSMPDVPAIAPPLAWSGPIDRNAADLYRGAYQALDYEGSSRPRGYSYLLEGWEPVEEEPTAFLRRNAQALELVRSASTLPDRRFFPTHERTLFNGENAWHYAELARLAGLSAADRRACGDLPGAWADVAVVFRVARHLAEGSTISDASLGSHVEGKALGLAMEWAADPRQTPDGLVAGLASYRGLPKFPPPSETIRGEAQLMERTLALPGKDLRRGLASILAEPRRNNAFWMESMSQFITTPWEVARARRATRWLFAEALREAERDPSQRTSRALGVSPTTERREMTRLQAEALQTSPLAKFLFPTSHGVLSLADRNEVGRRAFVLIVGLRHWALGHDGAYPATLDALAQGPIGDVPFDPYSNSPFYYEIISNEHDIRLEDALLGRTSPTRPSRPDAADGKRWALVSVGSNGLYDQGSGDDLVFPLPQGTGEVDSALSREQPLATPAAISP
ncbi:MAG: ABC transporter permease subunit [Isosphaeraceae bacterium]